MIYFTAHTFNCVCHSIGTMFRVLGVYNFGDYLKYWTLVDSLLRRPSNSKLGSSLLRKITSTSTSSLDCDKKILEEEYR